MIPALDFGVLAPEVNSGRIYAGAGPGPLLAAAAAWNGLAAELRCAAEAYSSMLAELNGHWHGPASAAMTAAAVPYMVWLGATAGRTEVTAARAEAAVAAYEAAFAATVPPAVVAANRVRLTTLIATNILGQNTPAIAATEAEYAEMWAQDAVAMYGYAAASSVATELPLFDSPRQITSAGGLSAQSAAVTQALGTGWNPFAPGSATDTAGLNGVLNALFGSDTAFGQFVNSNILNTIFMPAFYMPSKYLGTSTSLASLGQPSAPSAGQGAISATAAPVGTAGAQGNSVSASAGQAARVGPLSVPPSWATNSPSPSAPVAPLAKDPVVVPASQVGGPPALPLGGRAPGDHRAIPQYGFKPTFVARPPAAG